MCEPYLQQNQSNTAHGMDRLVATLFVCKQSLVLIPAGSSPAQPLGFDGDQLVLYSRAKYW